MKKRYAKQPRDPKRRAKSLQIRDGRRPGALKWREGLKETLSAEFGEPAKRLGVKPSEESEHIDDVAPEDVNLNKDDYDVADPSLQKLQSSSTKKKKQRIFYFIF